jgi:hypothetical protein
MKPIDYLEKVARSRASHLGHKLSSFEQNPYMKKHGCKTAHCLLCNHVALVAEEAPDFMHNVDGIPLVRRCSASEKVYQP